MCQELFLSISILVSTLNNPWFLYTYERKINGCKSFNLPIKNYSITKTQGLIIKYVYFAL